MRIEHGDIIERGERRFRVSIEADDDCDAPWEREDGHGPVRTERNTWRLTSKRAGERVLHTTKHTVWLYDWQVACKLARKDGWNAEPYDAPNRIERAVQADFDRLRRWLQDDWRYVGVCVAEVDDDDDDDEVTSRYASALWGIESDAGDYLYEVANELIDELIEESKTCETSTSTAAGA